METITINGEEYVKKSDMAYELADNWEHICIIATNGWVFEGYRDGDMTDDNGIQLINAHVVRKWENGLGLGAIADPEHKDDYTLDPMKDVYVYANKTIAIIALRW